MFKIKTLRLRDWIPGREGNGQVAVAHAVVDEEPVAAIGEPRAVTTATQTRPDAGEAEINSLSAGRTQGAVDGFFVGKHSE